MMQNKLVNSDESAWELGDLAYDLDDTFETGVVKAAQAGIRPGSDGYAAFITAFSRRVRSKQLSPRKKTATVNDVKNEVKNEVHEIEPPHAVSAIVFTPDFSRAAS